MDLALNNLHRLICHETQQNKPNIACLSSNISSFESDVNIHRAKAFNAIDKLSIT